MSNSGIAILGLVATGIAALGTIGAAVAAFLSWRSSDKSATAATAANQLAIQANQLAERTAGIEADRRHEELTPDFKISVYYPPGWNHAAVLLVAFTGPPALGRLDEIVIRVRVDMEHYLPTDLVAGGPTYGGLVSDVVRGRHLCR